MPTCARHVTFSFRFNLKVDNYLTATITHITFGYCFNQSINNCIPKSVTHLKFGTMFNQNLNTLHSSIEHICIHERYEQFIDGHIIDSISLTCLTEKLNIGSIMQTHLLVTTNKHGISISHDNSRDFLVHRMMIILSFSSLVSSKILRQERQHMEREVLLTITVPYQ